MAEVFDISSPAGKVLDLIADLKKQGRISGIEAETIRELIWHPDFPEILRRSREVVNRVTATVSAPSFPLPGSAADVPMVPRWPVTAAP